ncbi:hypothetical protein BVRB_6g137010 [Beta vulgaris subsp. vulgaris]|nr:hypothetical protein BVRB_6g137010 [Beta vulgaris subsp. vulgaris]
MAESNPPTFMDKAKNAAAAAQTAAGDGLEATKNAAAAAQTAAGDGLEAAKGSVGQCVEAAKGLLPKGAPEGDEKKKEPAPESGETGGIGGLMNKAKGLF